VQWVAIRTWRVSGSICQIHFSKQKSGTVAPPGPTHVGTPVVHILNSREKYHADTRHN
jgi:hypothetical protein